MEVTYDPNKNEKNIALRGLSFDRVAALDFDRAVFTIDARRDYGEVRRKALAFLGERLHSLIFVEADNGIRVVSFRKASRKEQQQYAKAKYPKS